MSQLLEKFEKRKVHSFFKDDIWDTFLADMQINKYTKELRLIMCHQSF